MATDALVVFGAGRVVGLFRFTLVFPRIDDSQIQSDPTILGRCTMGVLSAYTLAAAERANITASIRCAFVVDVTTCALRFAVWCVTPATVADTATAVVAFAVVVGKTGRAVVLFGFTLEEVASFAFGTHVLVDTEITALKNRTDKQCVFFAEAQTHLTGKSALGMFIAGRGAQLPGVVKMHPHRKEQRPDIDSNPKNLDRRDVDGTL